ncbi:hypothetical protein [Clostridium perfringens]|uniref:hypothetical protein n=1 Tax=Clostridium perfringens TaxID=1502 RepID=UPI000D70F3B2|nr:hypothetical protein [Clostridium perfringens]MBO3424424.1 hypothetical protein [Clostridium perfringens]PWX10396.1 hypothetical protein CYK69_14855 [Clostridium perfringens]PWX37278.1 hypothetical protein CYK94_08110 [Clostridium perfringens]PWX59091.1 hypothetical protein CYK88_07935 [Clostridium perfringens]
MEIKYNGEEIDEIVIRIKSDIYCQSEVYRELSNMGFNEKCYEEYENNSNICFLVYTEKESFINDYRKIKDRFSKTYISLELISGKCVLLTEEEYLNFFDVDLVDRRLFLEGFTRDEFEHFKDLIDDILENISINEEQRKIVEKFKKADTYRDLSIDEYYTIKDLFSLDEMEEE